MQNIDRPGFRIPHIPLAEKDKHKTVFRDAHGERWELNRCDFDLKTLPAAFAARVDPAPGDLKCKAVQNCLDGITIYTPAIEGHLELVGKVF